VRSSFISSCFYFQQGNLQVPVLLDRPYSDGATRDSIADQLLELGNGMSNLAVLVVEKVRRSKEISYNDLIDHIDKVAHTESGTRKRVLDILTVMVTLGWVTQETEQVKWTFKGNLLAIQQGDRDDLLRKINEKRNQLEEILAQTVAMHELIKRNKLRDNISDEAKIHLPFIVVSAPKDTTVEVQISDKETDLFLNLDRPFEIIDDTFVLSKMDFLPSQESISFLPPSLIPFVQLNKNSNVQ